MHRTCSTAPDWPGSPHESLVVEHSVLCSAVNMLIINTQLSDLIMWNRTTITRDQGTNDILTQTRNSAQTCIYWHCITRKPVSLSIFSSDISCWFDFQIIFPWLFMYSLTDWFSPRYIFTHRMCGKKNLFSKAALKHQSVMHITVQCMQSGRYTE